MHGLTKHELKTLHTLSTPQRIQDYLNEMPINEEKHGDTCLSPREVLRQRHAHCMEGAMLASLALRLHGHRPLLMDLKTTRRDFDHVVALFRVKGFWGAISKTNHAVLRYREPIYATIRELALSYFHEYFLDDGTKTLRSFSKPFDLSRFDTDGWMTADDDVWYVPAALDDSPHTPILTPVQLRNLRKADPIERRAGSLVEWSQGSKTRTLRS